MGNLGKIIANYDPVGQTQGKIEIYSLADGFVKVPTEIQKTSWLLYQILGNNPDGLLISPTFGKAKEGYYKSINEMRIPLSSGGLIENSKGERTHWHTQEDNLRSWMLKQPMFIDELVKDGWMYFEGFQKIDEEKTKDLKLPNFGNYCRAKVSLNNLARVLESQKEMYEKQLNDINELKATIGKSTENTDFIYKVHSGWDSFFFTKIAHKEGDLELRLSEVEDFFNIERNERYNDLLRKVSFNVPLANRGSSFWTEEMSSRVSMFTEEYANKKHIIRFNLSESNLSLEVELRSRKYTSQKEKNIKTGELIEQAADLRSFVRKAVNAEHHAYTSNQTEISNQRRIALGLLSPEVKTN